MRQAMQTIEVEKCNMRQAMQKNSHLSKHTKNTPDIVGLKAGKMGGDLQCK